MYNRKQTSNSRHYNSDPYPTLSSTNGHPQFQSTKRHLHVPISSQSTPHYDVYDKIPVSIDLTEMRVFWMSTKPTNYPLKFKGYESIQIPNKVRYAIKHLSRKKLKKIHENTKIAEELCLMFLSNLSDTYFRINGIGFVPDSYDLLGWKSLNSSELRKQFNSQDMHVKIRDILIDGTKDKGAIIECDNWYLPGFKSYSYRLGSNYINKGVETYVIQTKYVKELLRNGINERLIESNKNPICDFLIWSYGRLKLPTKEELLAHGKQQADSKRRNKKGKLITWKGKKSRTYWSTRDQRTFVEDNVELSCFLMGDGLIVPKAGGKASGGRVVDSFSLMPSWCRELILIDGEEIVEVDYKCLHPNIAVAIYGGSKRFITHEHIASCMDLDLMVVKNEHLSFFNKHGVDMMKSPLWDYYTRIEEDMMIELVMEKDYFGYKTTSRKLFEKEVEIMTKVISELKHKGIPALYQYDAVSCKKSDVKVVTEVMNKVVLDCGVYTRVG